jgi:hypothetical protein
MCSCFLATALMTVVPSASPASSMACLRYLVERVARFVPANYTLSKRGFILGQHIRKLLHQRQAARGVSEAATGTNRLAVRSISRSEDVLVDTRVLSPYDSDVHVRVLPPLKLGMTPEAGASCPSGLCLLYLLSSPSSYGIAMSPCTICICMHMCCDICLPQSLFGSFRACLRRCKRQSQQDAAAHRDFSSFALLLIPQPVLRSGGRWCLHLYN